MSIYEKANKRSNNFKVWGLMNKETECRETMASHGFQVTDLTDTPISAFHWVCLISSSGFALLLDETLTK